MVVSVHVEEQETKRPDWARILDQTEDPYYRELVADLMTDEELEEYSDLI